MFEYASTIINYTLYRPAVFSVLMGPSFFIFSVGGSPVVELDSVVVEWRAVEYNDTFIM